MDGGLAISATPEWAALKRHAVELRDVHLRDLFAEDSDRSARFTTEAGDLVIDWSRHLVTERTLELLLALAERAGVSAQLAAMMAGEPVNVTEDRPALHTALRGIAGGRAAQEPAREADAERERMAGLARRLGSGELVGATGRPIRTVVNLGIGGSHLGPQMAYEALAAWHVPGVECRFISSVDPSALMPLLAGGLDPAETLFVAVSKSFTTAETLANARSARDWLTAALGLDAVAQHFVAATANTAAAAEFGVAAERVFAMWDWVGGRYSLGSAASLSLMLGIGEHAFNQMLLGMRAADSHAAGGGSSEVGVASARSARPVVDGLNAAMVLGLLGVWNRNFLGMPTVAVVPYSERLGSLPAFLQQLVMESNGKSTSIDGTPVSHDTSPVIWGATGPDSQHSFHQMLLQGTTPAPVDFIVTARPDPDAAALFDPQSRQDMLAANCFAQASALAFGTPDEPDPHRRLPGNRPSTVIMAPQLTPSVLGQLVALYEHQVAVQGALWGINSFDQPAVEHAKTLAAAITESPAAPAHDPSISALLRLHHRLRTSDGS